MDPQVTMKPELPNMNWLLSDHQATEFGMDSISTSSVEQDISDWQALKAQISYMKKWPKYPQSPFCYAASSLPACIYGFMGELSTLKWKEDLGLVYYVEAYHAYMISEHQTTAPLLNIPEGQW